MPTPCRCSSHVSTPDACKSSDPEVRRAQHRRLLRILALCAGAAFGMGVVVGAFGQTAGQAEGVGRLAPGAGFQMDAPAGAFELETYTLPNGMRVVLHHDSTSPRVAVNIWYRVGARNEPAGRSGFAHLFEHLMFMGTRRVPGNDFDRLMEAGGGANNASTSLDRTNYFSSGPSSLLPTLLWLDADRLEDMGLTMTQDKLDKQRDVVRNEIRQNVENTPYARAYELSYRLLFPQGHPYRNAVYGSHEDLEAATLSDVRDFFATFYVPSNASLVVAGDFDKDSVRPLIERLYGTLPAGGAPASVAPPPPRLDHPIRQTILDQVQLPMLLHSFHSPAWYAEGDAEMDLLASVLAQGQSSRLYRRLVVEESLAADVFAYQESAMLGSIFRVGVMALPDSDRARIEAIVEEEIAKLTGEGPTEAELTRRKTSTERALLESMQDLETRADRFNQYLEVFGDANGLSRDLARYQNATPASVREWAGRVLTPQRLTMWVLPQDSQADPQNPREQRPSDLSPGAFIPQEPETFRLGAGGPQVMVFSRPGLPLVSMGVVFQSPATIDPRDRAGRAALLAQMLSEGTTSLTREEFADALQDAGATMSAGAAHESFSVSMSVLTRHLPRAAELLREALTAPRLAEEDFSRVQRLHVEELLQGEQEPAVIASRVASEVLLGEVNPYALPASGTPETARQVTLDDVRLAHNAIIRPENATIVLAGDITAQQARTLLEGVLGDWRGQGAPGPSRTRAPFDVPQVRGMRVLIVDRPESTQTMIHLLAPGFPARTDDRARLRLVNTVLGGSFTSRLNQNLREKHGFTYGARSRFAMEPSLGTFSASTSVQAEVTGRALEEFLKELTGIRGGDISAEELGKAQKTARDGLVSGLSTGDALVATAMDRVADDLPWESVGRELAEYERVNLEQANRAAAEGIRLDRAVLVLVGSEALIREQIKPLVDRGQLPKPTTRERRR